MGFDRRRRSKFYVSISSRNVNSKTFIEQLQTFHSHLKTFNEINPHDYPVKVV